MSDVWLSRGTKAVVQCDTRYVFVSLTHAYQTSRCKITRDCNGECHYQPHRTNCNQQLFSPIQLCPLAHFNTSWGATFQVVRSAFCRFLKEGHIVVLCLCGFGRQAILKRALWEAPRKIMSSPNIILIIFLFWGQQPPSGPGPPQSRNFLITHNDAPQSVGLLWTSDRPVAETSTSQHTTITTNIHVSGGILTHDHSRRAAEEPRLGPRDHWDRHFNIIISE